MRAIDLVPIEELSAVYMDVDGVLSIPRYPLGPNGAIVAFTENKRWEPFVDGNVDAYCNCYTPVALREWIDKLKAAGVPLYGLSVSVEGEEPSKLKFLDREYPDTFDEIILVRNASDKRKVMQEHQKKFGYEPFSMALVEDNHYTLFEIAETGFRGIHISWFLEALEPR